MASWASLSWLAVFHKPIFWVFWEQDIKFSGLCDQKGNILGFWRNTRRQKRRSAWASRLTESLKGAAPETKERYLSPQINASFFNLVSFLFSWFVVRLWVFRIFVLFLVFNLGLASFYLFLTWYGLISFNYFLDLGLVSVDSMILSCIFEIFGIPVFFRHLVSFVKPKIFGRIDWIGTTSCSLYLTVFNVDLYFVLSVPEEAMSLGRRCPKFTVPMTMMSVPIGFQWR